jgi:SpoVK/Ycf46/Vps4 family AAA+-type ATPase
MMFLGNPGTGKTTLARKVAEMLYSLGYLKENKCIEVGKQDIVGQYVGETAKKVSALIKSALGGVLFIDEAYSLCEVHNSGYGKEAMEVIVKSMEDYRDNLIIIFAGYEEEMQDFIKMNSGIMSRIGYTFNFKDYETDELYNIYELKMKELGFQLNDVEQSVKDSCNYFKSIENFGNGRFVDKLVQKTLLKHSSNYKNPIEITKEDIPTIAEMIKESVMDEDAMIFPSDITDENKKQVAYHESGHALAQYLLEDKIDIKEITIIPEGSGTLGYVLHKPNKKAMYSKEDYMNIIKRLLAGRAAEDIVYNTYFAGCSSDIEKATKYAYLMTSRLGMCNELVPIDLSNYKAGNALQDEIDNSVKEILNSCYKEIKALLEENKDLLYSLAEFMLSKNHITGEDFEEFLKKKDL